jgi:hypothetical protein
VKKILVILGLLICVACAQKPDLKPTQAEADHIRVLQLEAREAFNQVALAQQEYQKKIAAFQSTCSEVAKAHKWPAGITCSAQTAKDINELLVTPVSFAAPEKPQKPAENSAKKQ